MAKKVLNHEADISNKNSGTIGRNPSNKKAVDARANDLNPTSKSFKPKKK